MSMFETCLGSNRVSPRGFAAYTRDEECRLAGCGASPFDQESTGSDLGIEAANQRSRLRLHTQ